MRRTPLQECLVAFTTYITTGGIAWILMQGLLSLYEADQCDHLQSLQDQGHAVSSSGWCGGDQ